MGMSILDGAMRSIGNPSQPTVSPGGPFTPRPDLGPGVGFGPGLPPQEMEPGSLEDVDVMGGLGIPRNIGGGGKGGFGGPGYGVAPNPQPVVSAFGRNIGNTIGQLSQNQQPAVTPGVNPGSRNIDFAGGARPNLAPRMTDETYQQQVMGRPSVVPTTNRQMTPLQQNRFMPQGMIPAAGQGAPRVQTGVFRAPGSNVGLNPTRLNVRGRR